MKLPELPKKLNKREANWTTTVFRLWLKEKYKKTGVFEVKVSKINSLPFDAVAEHQVWSLLTVRNNTFVYKIPDMGEKCPFDVVCYTKQPAYIVVKYPKGVAIIAIQTWCLEASRSKRRSLTWERAQELSTIPFA